MEAALPLPQAAGVGGGEDSTWMEEHVSGGMCGPLDGVLEGHEETETVGREACATMAERATIPSDDPLGRALAREEEAATIGRESRW